jgi:hypothetical protein
MSVPDNLAVAIWTSANEHTCTPIISRILGTKSHESVCEFVWFRDRCDISSSFNKNEECKDLRKVYFALLFLNCMLI